MKCLPAGTPVALTDVSGSKTVAVLVDGTEVDILGWKPRVAGGARYRVRAVGGGSEGWLLGVNLRAVSPPTA